jgi:DNA primase
MTPFSQNDFVEEVKDKIDIVDVIGEYVQLKKTGKNYKGLCPFHQENTPSFTINPSQQFYHCFGCGEGGDVFNFLMEIEHITFKKGLKILAKRAGLEIPHQSEYQRKRANLRGELFTINELAAKFYNYLLLNLDVGEKALNYLSERGYTKENIKRYQLGYAPDRWDSLLNFLADKGYKRADLVKAGLVIAKDNNRHYDRFRNRIIFPINNIRGEVLAFGGRIISSNSSQPKYLNSPETMIYDKGENLYGINWAKASLRAHDNAVIMEGYTDVLTAHMEGIENAVASLGTALTAKQARFLQRYVSRVYIAYDADTAGAKATLRGLDILQDEGLSVRVIGLPDDMDPDDFIKQKGSKAFEELKEEALELVEFKIEQVIQSKQDNKADEKVNLTRKIVKILADLKDPLARDVYAHQIADRLSLDGEILHNEVEKFCKKKVRKGKKDKNNKNSYTKNINKTKSNDSIYRLERRILKVYIDYPEYRAKISENLTYEHFFNNLYRKVFRLLSNNKINNIDSFIDNIEDDKIKQLLMKLVVNEKKDIPYSTLRNWILKLKEKYRFQEKKRLYNELQQNDLTLESLNRFLVNFQRLNKDHREEGSFHD